MKFVSGKFIDLISFLREIAKENGWEILFAEVTEELVDIGIATKADGLTFLTEKEGIALVQVSAIGDGLNDVEMLEAIGFPGAPLNAMDEVKDVVKRKGGIVATHENGAGVDEILDKIIKESNGKITRS